MVVETDESSPIPGMEAVGHGIYLRPRQPYELRGVLFKRVKHRAYTFKDAGRSYVIPEGYDVNDSPPMPADQFLNQTVIEDSWDRFDKQMSLDANVSASNAAFSINAGVNRTSQLRSDEEAHYAVRCSFIPLWSVYLSDTSAPAEEIEKADIPHPFKFSHRRAYEAFFRRFGSHYVKRAWVGGKAQIYFTVLKSSGISKEELRSSIAASYLGAGSAAASSRQAEAAEKLRNSAQCLVSGRGGDEVKLAALSTLDERLYNEWLSTVRDNPQTIELEVEGIWTLIKDRAKADALAEAYKAANTFTPISAAFGIDRTIYCVRGRQYFCYQIDKGESEKPKLLVERFPRLGEIGFDRIDAAFRGTNLISPAGDNLSRKIFLFRRNQYVRIDIDKNEVERGYPRLIAEDFPGVTFPRLDTALEADGNLIYFFMGSQYVRFNMTENRVEDGYPEPITKRWIGVTFDRLDACIYWGNGKVFFFKDDQHIRYDMVTCRADPGYPKFILGMYVEDWKFFD